MVRVADEGTLPTTLERLWRVLAQHFDDEIIREIHPSIRQQRTIETEGEVRYRDLVIPKIGWFERDIRLFGRAWRSTWEVTGSPPESYRWEILASDRFLKPGSYVKIECTDSPEGIFVRSRGELLVTGMPGSLQSWLVRRVLNRIDNEDLRYLQRKYSK